MHLRAMMQQQKLHRGLRIRPSLAHHLEQKKRRALEQVLRTHQRLQDHKKKLCKKMSVSTSPDDEMKVMPSYAVADLDQNASHSSAGWCVPSLVTHGTLVAVDTVRRCADTAGG